MKVGDKLILAKDIYDDGADCYPPGYIAFKDETVIVRSLDRGIAVSHEHITDRLFYIYEGEY